MQTVKAIKFVYKYLIIVAAFTLAQRNDKVKNK